MTYTRLPNPNARQEEFYWRTVTLIRSPSNGSWIPLSEWSFAAEPKRAIKEAEFWVRLEFRLSQEFAGLQERRYRYFWCDGLDPEQYLLDGPSPRVTGTALICNGSREARWDFTLLLPRSFQSREHIDWASLLPADDVTRWMSFDVDKQYVEIEPGAAKPDVF